MTKSTLGKIIKGSAIGLDVATPLIATLTQFPIWVERSSDATVSGLFLIFALISLIPFWKQIKSFFKSPSIWVIWVILFCFFIVLRNILDEMIVVCFIGVLSNIIGAGVYKLGKFVGGEDDSK